MSDPRGFDPRYSPEFQRGFEAASRDTAETSREGRDLRRERPAQARVAPMPVVPMPVAPVASPPAARGNSRNSADSIERLLRGEPDEEAGDGHAGDAPEDELEAPLWRNPYLITLAILGVVLTVGGVGLFRWSVERVYTGQFMGGTGSDGPQDWMWVQVAWGLAPLLAIAGALTVLGIFFFLATKWAPRRDTDEDDSDEFDD